VPRLSWKLVLATSAIVLGSLSGCVREQKWPKRHAKAWCKHAVKCGTFRSVSDCRGVVTHEFDDPYISTAIDAGRIDYDGDAAYRCTRAIKKLECNRDEDQSEVEEDCAEVMTGTVAPDEACMRNEECLGAASVCAIVPGGCTAEDSCCPGVCRFIPSDLDDGESCAGPAECSEGSYCAPGTQADPEPRCARLPKVGRACPDNRCIRGAFCDDGTCALRRAPGETCSGNRSCAANSVCAYSYDGESAVCVERVRTGKECDAEVGDQMCLRVRDRCEDGVCDEHRKKDGEECSNGYYSDSDCHRDSACRGGVCTKFSFDGDSCEGEDEHCFPGLTCVDGECIPDPELAPDDADCGVPE